MPSERVQEAVLCTAWLSFSRCNISISVTEFMSLCVRFLLEGGVVSLVWASLWTMVSEKSKIASSKPVKKWQKDNILNKWIPLSRNLICQWAIMCIYIYIYIYIKQCVKLTTCLTPVACQFPIGQVDWSLVTGPTDHCIPAAPLWSCTVCDWMTAMQWSFCVWPKNWLRCGFKTALRNAVYLWLGPCTQNDCEDLSGYGPSQ